MSEPRKPTIGTSPPKVDAMAKVTGRAIYVDDIQDSEHWHGLTVRSSIAHGKLVGFERDSTFDWKQVVVVTAEDIVGDNVVALMVDDQPALVPVGGTIKHQDEALAIVVAPTKELMREAHEALRPQVETLDAVLTIDEAIDAKVKVYGDDNILKRLEIKKGQDIETAMAAAHQIIEGTYFTGAQEQMYIEPQGLMAWWREGRVYVEGSMQCPYYIHAAMKRAFNLSDTDIIVGQSVTGGGFGGKEEYPSMLAIHVALAAQKSKRTVKMIYSRGEDIGATTKRHPCRTTHRMGLNKDGTIAAIDIDVIIDGGAYVTLSPVVLSRAILHAAGPYRCENVRIVGRAMATHTPPHGAYRGFGAPQTTFAYERQAEKAAQALGLSSWDFRRKNMLRSGDITATQQKISYSVASAEVLDAVEEASKKPSPYATDLAPDDALRGRGLAFYFHGAGFTGRGEERLQGKVAVALCQDGFFEVRSASTDIGQGPLTIFTQIASDTLGVPPSLVRVSKPQTDMVPDSGPTVASRTCMVVGSVVAAASRAVKNRLLEFADKQGLEGSLSDIAESYLEIHGEFSELATYKSPEGISFDDVKYVGDAYPVYGWAACLADVAVDPDTLEVKIERLIHAIDVGKAIHPIIVKGQIEGGTLQALGWALWEHVVYQDGRVMNRRMTDSIIPTAIEAPEMETIIVEVPYPHGPEGAKGVGEIPMDGPGAAIANAVADAMKERLKSPPDSLPLLPEYLHRLTLGQSSGCWLPTRRGN